MTIGDPTSSVMSTSTRRWLAIGLAIGAVIGLALGLLVGRNGVPAETAAPTGPPATVTVTATPEKQIVEPPAAVTEETPPSVDDPEQATDESESLTLTDPIGPVGDLSTRVDGDPLAVGSVDAPVVMVMFSDYRCPFCAQFSQTTEDPLIEKYVTNGTMRIEWRDFPIFGEESMRAAIAGRAAAKQGKFWEFNNALYAAAPGSGHPELPVDELVDFAERAGVADIDAFRADLASDDLRAAVEADRDLGNTLGVPATPSFVINGYPVRGAQPFNEFVKVIDAVLAIQD